MSDKKNSVMENDSQKIQEILDRLKASIDKYEESVPSNTEPQVNNEESEEKIDLSSILSEFEQVAQESETEDAEKVEVSEEAEEEETEEIEEIEKAEELEEAIEEIAEVEKLEEAIEGIEQEQEEAFEEDGDESRLQGPFEQDEPTREIEIPSIEQEEFKEEFEDIELPLDELFQNKEEGVTEPTSDLPKPEQEKEQFSADAESLGVTDELLEVDNTVDISMLGAIMQNQGEEDQRTEHRSRSFRMRLKESAEERKSLSEIYGGEEEENDYDFLDDFFEAKRKAPQKTEQVAREETFEEMGDPEEPTEIFTAHKGGMSTEADASKPHFAVDEPQEELVQDEQDAESEPDLSAYYIKDDSVDYKGREQSSAGDEYSSPNQVDKINEDYSARLLKAKIKMIAVAVFALILLVLENAPWVAIDIPAILNISGASTYALLDMQIFVIIAAISYVEFYHGIKGIIQKKIRPESFVVCVSVFSVLYNITLCINGESYPTMYSFPSAVLILMQLLANYIELCGESDTFRCFSSQGDKLVGDIIPESEVAEKIRSSFVGRDSRLNVMRIKKVGFVEGFFERMSKKTYDYKLNSVLLSLSLAFSLLMGVITLLIAKEPTFTTFFSAFIVSVLLSVSASVFFAHIFPVYMLEKKAIMSDCAIVGESSVNQYADISVISFEDVEAFSTRKTKIGGMVLFNEYKPQEVLFYVASIFSVLNGPLCGIFKAVSSDIGISENVELTDVSQSGLTAVVDGREFKIGKGSYMQSKGVTLFYDSEDELQLEKGNVSIMFVCEGDTLCAKFFVEYDISTRFVRNVSRLNDNNILTVIRSYDPNIDERLIEKVSNLDSSYVSVVKKEASQIYDYAQLRVNSGLVTGSISKEIINMIFLCIKTKKLIRLSKIAIAVTAGIGMTLALMFTLTGMILSLPPITMTLVSLLTIMPTLVLGSLISK